MYKLSRYESETTILFNEEEKEAKVYTCSNSLMSKMDKLVLSGYGTVVKQDKYSKTYLIPKKYLRFTAPPKRTYTENQKQEFAKKMKAFRLIDKNTQIEAIK